MRIDSQYNLKNSAPCTDCSEIIKGLNIKKIVYSVDNYNFNVTKPEHYNIKHYSIGNKFLNGNI